MGVQTCALPICFTGVAGQHLLFDMLTRSGDPLTVRIYRPDGIEMQAATGLADIELSALPMDGDYVIEVEGRIDNTASAAFTARVIEIGETARAIGIGAPVGGDLVAGQHEDRKSTPLN